HWRRPIARRGTATHAKWSACTAATVAGVPRPRVAGCRPAMAFSRSQASLNSASVLAGALRSWAVGVACAWGLPRAVFLTPSHGSNDGRVEPALAARGSTDAIAVHPRLERGRRRRAYNRPSPRRSPRMAARSPIPAMAAMAALLLPACGGEPPPAPVAVAPAPERPAAVVPTAENRYTAAITAEDFAARLRK